MTEQLERIIPDDPKVMELKKRCSMEISITSEPAGAKVYAKPYSKPDSVYQLMGTTPLENVLFPSGNISIRIEKEKYETTEDLIWLVDFIGGKQVAF